MPSNTVPRHAPGLARQPWVATLVAAGIVISAVLAPNVSAQFLGERGDKTTRRFYPDDPIRVDPDRISISARTSGAGAPRRSSLAVGTST